MTTLIFVHGINSSRSERAAMPDRLTALLDKFGVTPLIDAVAVATWRSLGDFMGDLVDLKTHHVRWQDAVDDVVDDIREAMEFVAENAVLAPPPGTLSGAASGTPPGATSSDRDVVFVGHSMGQPLLISALDAIVKAGTPPWRQARILTLGGPMGNLMARPYFVHMNQDLWQHSPGGLVWHDYYNPEDPVCGGPTYRHFDAATSHRLDFPGHPTPLEPFKEHSSYFDASDVYALVMALAESMRQTGA